MASVQYVAVGSVFSTVYCSRYVSLGCVRDGCQAECSQDAELNNYCGEICQRLDILEGRYPSHHDGMCLGGSVLENW